MLFKSKIIIIIKLFGIFILAIISLFTEIIAFIELEKLLTKIMTYLNLNNKLDDIITISGSFCFIIGIIGFILISIIFSLWFIYNIFTMVYR